MSGTHYSGVGFFELTLAALVSHIGGNLESHHASDYDPTCREVLEK